MKKILFVFAMIVFATTFFVNGAYAQGAQYGNEQEIPWINYSIDIDEALLTDSHTTSLQPEESMAHVLCWVTEESS